MPSPITAKIDPRRQDRSDSWAGWVLENVWVLRVVNGLRESFWFQPMLLTALGVVVALVCLYLDSRFGEQLAFFLPSPAKETTRAVSSTMAGSIMGVIGTTFTITMAVLTLASGQFGPRLLRQFLKDGAAQGTLGLFLATFVYHLTALAGADAVDKIHGPALTFYVGLLVAILSLIALVFFIQHFAQGIQIDHLVDAIGQDFSAQCRGLSVSPDAYTGERPVLDYYITAGSQGYVRSIDLGTLTKVAQKHDCTVVIVPRPGTHMIDHEVLMQVDMHLTDDVIDDLRACVHIGSARSGNQDMEFSIDQLAEIAVRALSPGINDPYTAERCIDRLTENLCEFAPLAPLDQRIYDGDGAVRVWMRWPTLHELMSSATHKLRQAAMNDVSGSLRLITMCQRIAASTPSERVRDECLARAESVWMTAQAGSISPADLHVVHSRYLDFKHGPEGHHADG